MRLEIRDEPELQGLLPLLRLELYEFEAVLGTPVVISGLSDASSHVWRIRVDPTVRAAELHADYEKQNLISVVSSAQDFGMSLNLLHWLAHSEHEVVRWEEAGTRVEVVRRVSKMLDMVYPAFELRGFDRAVICSPPDEWDGVTDAGFWELMQQWVARCQDAHTAVVPPGKRYHPPYRSSVKDDGVLLYEVPMGSAAQDAGLEDGWSIPPST